MTRILNSILVAFLGLLLLHAHSVSSIGNPPTTAPRVTPREHFNDIFDQAAKIFQNHLDRAFLETQALLEEHGFKGEDLDNALMSASDAALAAEKLVEETHSFHHADRHLKRVQEMVDDEDCLSREFNAQDANFDYIEAGTVLQKCRLLILRNVHSPEAIAKFKKLHTEYLRELKETNPDDIDQRVLYDGSIARYENLVPKNQYIKELAENPQILKLLQHPRLLDDKLFVHSYGTSITEPGTPHQDWHQEDDYIFDSFDSFKYSGVAGHDLPPYTINMFSPLLNLTHDHGPTEFCLGSSHLTGLYESFDFDANKHVPPPLFDADLLYDSPDFIDLWRFGQTTLLERTQAPCPPQFLRSALLNVGDVVLFDYQILHRAGHNLSNETRAQLYIAYARSWFRDLNYHVNTHGSDDSVEADYSTHTRFAGPLSNNPDEQKDDWEHDDEHGDWEDEPKDSSPPATEELEALRDILPITGDPLFSSKRKKQHLFVSAIDLAEGTSVWVDGKRKAEVMTSGPTQIPVTANVGSQLSIHSPTGVALKTWEVLLGMQQLVVSRAILCPDDASKCSGAMPSCVATAE